MPLNSLLPLCLLEFMAHNNSNYSVHCLSIDLKIQAHLSRMSRKPRLVVGNVPGTHIKEAKVKCFGAAPVRSSKSPLGRFVSYAGATAEEDLDLVAGLIGGVEVEDQEEAQEHIEISEMVEMGGEGVEVVGDGGDDEAEVRRTGTEIVGGRGKGEWAREERREKGNKKVVVEEEGTQEVSQVVIDEKTVY